MKYTTTVYPILNSVQPFDIQPDIHFTNAESDAEQNQYQLLALYRKYNDEPDFDCEFLNHIRHDHSENIIDPDSEEDQADHFNDDKWDAEIYDPYLESTYY